MKNQAEQKIWRLLAISLDPDKSDPELYGLILEGVDDQPLLLNDRILFFRDASRAEEIVRKHGSHLEADRVDVAKPFFWCDVAQTLYLLQAGGIDNDACVLGAINALLDLVKATGLNIQTQTKAALHSIANFCTMDRNITKYLEEEGDYSSEALTDAVLWCVGAICVSSTIFGTSSSE
jgi:hypothetical protein